MKYFETLIEDQETTISVLYEEQIIKIYSSEPKTIQKLTKALGQPAVKYKKSKTYWSGASWDVNFFDIDKLSQILNRDAFIDKKLKPIEKKEKVKASKKVSTKKENEETKKEKSGLKKGKAIYKEKVEKKKTVSKKVTKNKEISKKEDNKIFSKAEANKRNKSNEKIGFEQIQLMF